jgi:hypothetical protein
VFDLAHQSQYKFHRHFTIFGVFLAIYQLFYFQNLLYYEVKLNQLQVQKATLCAFHIVHLLSNNLNFFIRVAAQYFQDDFLSLMSLCKKGHNSALKSFYYH